MYKIIVTMMAFLLIGGSAIAQQQEGEGEGGLYFFGPRQTPPPLIICSPDWMADGLIEYTESEGGDLVDNIAVANAAAEPPGHCEVLRGELRFARGSRIPRVRHVPAGNDFYAVIPVRAPVRVLADGTVRYHSPDLFYWIIHVPTL